MCRGDSDVIKVIEKSHDRNHMPWNLLNFFPWFWSYAWHCTAAARHCQTILITCPYTAYCLNYSIPAAAPSLHNIALLIGTALLGPSLPKSDWYKKFHCFPHFIIPFLSFLQISKRRCKGLLVRDSFDFKCCSYPLRPINMGG